MALKCGFEVRKRLDTDARDVNYGASCQHGVFTGKTKREVIHAHAEKKKAQLSVSTLHAACQKEFSRYIRLRDTDAYGWGHCFTCGSYLSFSQLQAGHMLSRTYSGALYDERVVYAQCRYCNHMREGNHMAGTLKLVAKYGLDTVMRWVVEDREPHQFSSEELKAKIEDFRLRSDELAQTKRR